MSVLSLCEMDIKNVRKLRKLQLFFSIYPNEKSVKFQSCDFSKIGVLLPSTQFFDCSNT